MTISSPPRPVRPGARPPEPSGATSVEPAGRSRLVRVVRGADTDPRWARPAFLGLLAVTAVLYLWGLGRSGDANSFYAAAVQAGTQSWKAMFFGSLDSANAITVDKPAFFLWPMEIAGRLFGFSSWSMLVPQALEGVAAVGLLAAAVRRVAGYAAGIAAGLLLAVTPVATLMFRFDNPDAMLVLLLTAAGYATVRSLATARGTRWITLAGTLIGLAFITKMGQALLVVPALGLTYLVAAPTTLRRRITDLLGAGVAMIAGAGWYIAIVELWPASSRPYIGGSTDNSLLELAFGYNGLGRLFGSGSGNGGGGGGTGGNSSFGGATGLTRLFRGDFATEVSWLLPTALLALAAGLWLTRRAPRTGLSRAALILFGGWLLVTGITFSFMSGTIHPYYTIALAPAIAAVVAVAGRLLWQARTTRSARGAGLIAAVLVLVTAGWDAHLLALTPTFLPWLKFVVVVAAVLAAAGLLVGRRLRSGVVIAVALACLSGVAGSAAYAVDTASQAHSGSIPTSGPVTSGIGGGTGGAGGVGGTGGGGAAPTGTRPTGTMPSGTGTGTTGTAPTGTGTGTTGTGTTGTATTGSAGGGTTSSAALTTLLKATSTRWAAATVGSQSAATLELSSGTAVIAIGGFTGSDASPTLAQFEAYVAAGDVHYFIATGTGAGGGGTGASSTSTQITAWVKAHYTATTVGGTTVYDLTAAATS